MISLMKTFVFQGIVFFSLNFLFHPRSIDLFIQIEPFLLLLTFPMYLVLLDFPLISMKEDVGSFIFIALPL